MPRSTTVIVVGFNSADVIEGLLNSLPSGTQTIVVDNASSDQTISIAKAVAPRAKVVRLSRNEGFGRACNLGAEIATTPFLFFVNPDVRLTTGTITSLENAATQLPHFVAANPQILNAKGNGRIKTSSILSLKQVPHPQFAVDSELAVLSGAAFFVRTRDFHAAGGFDPNIFLYHEDHDLAVRLVANGGSLWHVSDASVTHEAGTGSARSAATAFLKGYHMARSRHYVLSKYNRRLAFLRTFVPAVVGLGVPFNLLSARRRAKYQGQIKGALSSFSDCGVYSPK